MTTEREQVKVERREWSVFGKPDKGTRIYRRSGPAEDMEAWYDAIIAKYPDGAVSPGGVTMYAPVSRAAVHKRILAGKLTAFAFHVKHLQKTWFGTLRRVRETPYMFIPVSECKAWAAELKERQEEAAHRYWLPDREFERDANKIEEWPKPPKQYQKGLLAELLNQKQRKQRGKRK